MSAYSDQILADNPYLYWRLGDTSGSTAEDATANNRDGTYQNTPTLGVVGLIENDPDTAVTFNGVDEWILRSDTGPQSFTQVTLEIWCKLGTASGTLMHLAPGTQDWEIGIGYFATGPGNTGNFIASRSNFWDVIEPGSPHSPNDICHVAFTFAGGTGRLYVNCVEVASGTGLSSGFANVTELRVGRYSNRINAYWPSVLDEVAVFPTALSADRLLLHCDPPVCDLLTSDDTLMIDASASSRTVRLFDTLDAAPHIYYIKRIDGSTNTVTIDPNGTTIDRQASMILQPRDAIAVIHDSQEWWTL